MIDEISINQKKNIEKKAVDGIQGKNSSIKTIAIMTAENPNADDIDYSKMSKSYVNRQNKKLKRNLNSTLKDSGYVYKPILGKYGDVEHSVMIFNISLNNAIYFGKYYGQSSIIFCERNEDGTMSYQYYESENDFASPTKEEYKLEDANSDDDFFSKISNKFKFRIPFKFESVEKFISKLISEGRTFSKVEKLLNESIYLGGYKGYISRKKLYHGKGLI
jgi:hypothetical protein